MSDFSVRSDHVDVEQIMRQIRTRIRDKRGVDYTEDEIRQLADVKLETFLDPRGIRSDLLRQYQRQSRESPVNFAFEAETLFESHRGVVRFFRNLLRPILKLFFNPGPLIDALHIQSKLNDAQPIQYEILHNLVVELTRTSVEVKNLKMRLESIASRLDFDERRARALEGVVQYRPGTAAPLQPPTSASGPASNQADQDGNERRTRRRRRRGRRRPGQGAPGEASRPETMESSPEEPPANTHAESPES